MKSELKITGAAGILGALPVFLELVQGDGVMSEKLMMALVGCVTVMVVGYNIARGLAKTEDRPNGSPSTGMRTTEFKVSAGVAGLGAVPVLIDMLKGGSAMSENVRMVLMFAITAIALSYTLSRGMVKRELRPPSL